MNWTEWKKEILYFQKLGFSTLALDLRGHGKSDIPQDFESYSIEFFYKDLECILKKERIEKFSLIGHSFGGAIAIVCCMKKEKMPQSVILVESGSTYPYKHNKLLNLSPYLTHLLRFISTNKITKKHFKDFDLSKKGITLDINFIRNLLQVTPIITIIKALDNVEKYIFKNQLKINATLKNLDIPLLVIAGKKDHIFPLKYSRKLVSLNPHAQLKIIENADHFVTVKMPKELCQIMLDFLTSTS